MFDWDDQELANILWGEAGESEDHIVPYPEGAEENPPPVAVYHRKTEINDEDANNEAAEKQIQDSERNFEGVKFDRDGNIYGGKCCEDPQPATFVAARLKADENVVAPLRHGREDPEGQCEDEDLGELIDNSWAHIGSFDDLDRIFSNDDLAANSNLGSTDELWSSPKDIIAEADESSFLAVDPARWEADLGIASVDFDMNNESFSYESSSFVPAPEMVDYSTSCGLDSVSADLDQVEHGVGTCVTSLEEKQLTVDLGPSSRMQVNPNQFYDKHRRPIFSNLYQPSAAIPQLDGYGTPSALQNYPPYMLTQKRLSQKSGVPYQQFPSQYFAAHSDIYGNLNNQFATLPAVQSTDDDHQSVLSSPDADVVSKNKSQETPSRPVNMTPQEKIEKLRRRQKIHAMLAIQKQRQQLAHQVSVSINSVADESTPEDQRFLMERSCIPSEDNLGIPGSEINSHLKWDEPNHTSVGEDGNTVEDAILRHLHGIIDKLDVTIRLCIRDSLFRLAQSASQRQYVSETSSTNASNARKPDPAREDTSNIDRLSRTPVAETETNHIDRVVAHLLFHRPFEFSIKPSGIPEPSYTRASTQQETDTSSQQLGHSTPRTKNQHDPSPKGSKRAFPASGLHQEEIGGEFQQADVRTNRNSKEKPKEHGN